MFKMVLGVVISTAIYLGINLGTPEPHAKALDVLQKTAIQLNNNCSGTIVDKKRRLVVTAFHCVQGYKKDFYHVIDRIIYNPDGTEKTRYDHLAKVVKTNSKEDLAILEIVTGVELPAEVKLSEDTLKRGDTIFALGNPFGWEYLFSQGTVLNPRFIADDQFPSTLRGIDYVAIDHTSYHGSSGSGLVNRRGELVAVHTLGNGAGFRWAVPVYKVAKLLSFVQ